MRKMWSLPPRRSQYGMRACTQRLASRTKLAMCMGRGMSCGSQYHGTSAQPRVGQARQEAYTGT